MGRRDILCPECGKETPHIYYERPSKKMPDFKFKLVRCKVCNKATRIDDGYAVEKTKTLFERVRRGEL